MLNTKQENFVQYLVQGLSQRQAYKKAYGVDYDEKAIDNNASKLFNKDEVQARYNELVNEVREEITKNTIMTATERMEWLTKIVKEEIKEKTAVLKTDADGKSELVEQEFPSKLDTKIKALDILNKMDGEYTTKIEGTIATKKLEDLL